MKNIKAKAIVTLSTPNKELCDQHLNVAKINLNNLYKIRNFELIKPEELGDKIKFFSGSIEFDIELKSIAELFDFLVKFMPISFEIEEPSKIEIDPAHLTAPLNDLIGDLQQIQNSKNTYETSFLHICQEFHKILSSRERNKDAKLKEVLYKVFKPKVD